MADRRDQHPSNTFAPPGEFAQAGEDVVPKERAERLGNVAGARAEIGTALGLKADIQFAEIVQRCKDAQASPANFSEVPTCETGQPPSPDRKPEQRLDHRSHVRTVIQERMPLAHAHGVVGATELPPESRGLT
jgi:hypothetical protein